MNELEPAPDYETPVGYVSPATVAIVAYAVPVLVAASSLTYAVQVGHVSVHDELGAALWVGVITSVVAASATASYVGRWYDGD